MRTVNVGLIGSGFMAKAHSLAYANVGMYFWPRSLQPRRLVVADVSEKLAQDAAARYGYERAVVGWQAAVEDPEVELVDICTPNSLHRDIAIAAAQRGKHILCEKPLALNAAEAEEMYRAAERAGVVHMVAFNYRRTPAVVLARQLIEQGRLGRIYNFRGHFLSEWAADPEAPISWRFKKALAGSGAAGDVASHVIDLARYLVGEITEVVAVAARWVEERPATDSPYDAIGRRSGPATRREKVEVDDEVSFLLRFDNGAIGRVEASRFAWGRKNYVGCEINGSEGSIVFNYERLQELHYYPASDPDEVRGFRTILTGPQHPYGSALWPVGGFGVGYVETKVIEVHELLEGIAVGQAVPPTFYDGWKVAQVVDAALRSAETRQWEQVGG